MIAVLGQSFFRSDLATSNLWERGVPGWRLGCNVRFALDSWTMNNSAFGALQYAYCTASDDRRRIVPRKVAVEAALNSNRASVFARQTLSE